MTQQTAVTRKSDRQLVVTRRFDAPARHVFAAWTTPDLLMRWWAPKSMGMPLVACDVDARTGGGYRFEFRHAEHGSMVFFGKYVEVTPCSRLVWTNEESDAGAVTTVTLTEQNGWTLLVLSELYPSKEALDAAFIGMEDCMPEQFRQLDEFLAAASAGG